MKSINRVTLLGNLEKDPELRTIGDGTSVVSCVMATTETFKDKNGEKKEQTEWHNLVLWRSLAEVFAQYCKKGDTVHIDGKLRTRNWEAQDGSKRYMAEIIVDDFILVSKKTQ